MKRVVLAGAALAAMCAAPAYAQDAAASGPDLSSGPSAIGNRFYVAPMGSHVWEDSQRDTDDGWGGVLAIGKQLSSGLAVEISGLYQELGATGSDNTEIIGYGASALFFPFSGTLSRNLYGIVGAHYGEVDSHPSTTPDHDYETVLGSAGLGFLYGPFSWLNQGSIRAEALYRVDFHDQQGLGSQTSFSDDDFGDIVANVGLLIPIGSLPEPPPPPEPAVEVVPVQAPVDSDGDGVPDDIDQCPDTPAGEPVNEVGCPLPKKECKTPEPGQPVTLEGCAAGDKIVLRGVNFDFDKATLTPNAKTILDGVGTALDTAPSVTVELGGHTDAKGTDEYNQKLSERRASSVRQYLIGKGIDAGRMTSAGYGESQPVADNDSDEGRELNRRVELKVTGGLAEVAPSAPAAADEAAPAEDAAIEEAAPAEEAVPAADAAPAAEEAPAAE